LQNSFFDCETITKIRDLILARHETVSIAESVTSGLGQAAFAQAPDASGFFQGGITAYNIGQKYLHLSVEPIHAQSVNCVSERVAAEMALNSCRLFSSDWGLGITGYASPVPESGSQVFAYFAIAHGGGVQRAGKIIPPEQSPFESQVFFVNDVLRSFYSVLASF